MQLLTAAKIPLGYEIDYLSELRCLPACHAWGRLAAASQSVRQPDELSGGGQEAKNNIR